MRPLVTLVLIGLCALALPHGLRAAEGDRLWRSRISGAQITYSSPALSPDAATVYVGFERANTGGLVALSTATGALRWARALPGPVDATPAVGSDGTVYVGAINGTFYALDPADGRTRWEFFAGFFISTGAAVGRDGTIYFGDSGGRLFALRSDGTERWRYATGDRLFASPVIGADGTIYLGSTDRHLYALDPEAPPERRLKWRYETGGAISSSVAIGANGTLYFGSQDQYLYALQPDGTLRWRYLTNGAIDASPVLGADGTVYVPSADTFLHALDPVAPDRRRSKWQASMGVSSASSPAVRADGVIVIGADDGRIRAFNAEGTLRWTHSTEDFVESSPLVAPDGSIFVGSADGHLYKLEGNGSPLSTISNWPAFQRDLRRTAWQPPPSPARLVNLSARVAVGGTSRLIAGFYVQAATPQPYLLRAVGPTLAEYGVTGFMPDPRLELYSGSALRTQNDNWSDAPPGFGLSDTFAGVQAFPLPPGSRDAGVIPALESGSFSTHVLPADGQGGVVLAEIYDARGSDPNARLVNLSVRNQAGVGEQTLIVGFVVAGSGPCRLLLRAVGPTLTAFGVSEPLQQPTLTLYQGNQVLSTNTRWGSAGNAGDLAGAASRVAAFALPPGSADSALVTTVSPGSYTVQITGVGGTTGEALAEIYVLP